MGQVEHKGKERGGGKKGASGKIGVSGGEEEKTNTIESWGRREKREVTKKKK